MGLETLRRSLLTGAVLIVLILVLAGTTFAEDGAKAAPASPADESGQYLAVVSGPEGPEVTQLSGVAAIAPDDVWAVGSSPYHGIVDATFVHWNGTKWDRVPLPGP